MKFQTYEGGGRGERKEERGGKQIEKGRAGERKGQEKEEKRKLAGTSDRSCVNLHVYKKKYSSYLYFLEVSCFERVPRLTHIHILFRKTLNKYTVVKRYIY